MVVVLGDHIHVLEVGRGNSQFCVIATPAQHTVSVTLVKAPCSMKLCILAEMQFIVITGVSPSELTEQSPVHLNLFPATIPCASPATHSTLSPPSLNSPAGRVHGSPLVPCLRPRGTKSTEGSGPPFLTGEQGRGRHPDRGPLPHTFLLHAAPPSCPLGLC